VPTLYEIRVEGYLESNWSEWLDGMTITLLENGETLLSGSVVDQAALHGLLAKIRDMNLKLISVNESPLARPVEDDANDENVSH